MKVIKEIWYHHSKPIEGKIRITACCIITEDDRAFVGLSVCNPQDNFVKEFGRNKSFERAKFDPTFEITHMLNRTDKPRKAFCNWCKDHVFPELYRKGRLYTRIDYKDKNKDGSRKVNTVKPKFNLLTFIRNLFYGKSSNY